MFCARCGKPISRFEPRIWAVLPGGKKMEPTCRDDRLCCKLIPKRKQASKKTNLVRRLAMRYAL
ncbi:hypothetical protein [Pelosinus sp. UFO1]|uniref:hypothetical protein n=1 Tax=Pelosinus sp. UFO1 TaxID=484770 RepID=UPI00056E0362|nr:hypothetical protein [Pelosinus sp. UFO1]